MFLDEPECGRDVAGPHPGHGADGLPRSGRGQVDHHLAVGAPDVHVRRRMLAGRQGERQGAQDAIPTHPQHGRHTASVTQRMGYCTAPGPSPDRPMLARAVNGQGVPDSLAAEGEWVFHAGGLDQPIGSLGSGGSGMTPAGPKKHFFLADWRGNIARTVNDSGQDLSLASMAFAPFGEPEGATGGSGSNPGYNGAEHWGGLVYMRHRSYDPSTGSFTQEAPIGMAGGMNRYQYAGSDPVNYADPFGLCPIEKDGIPCAVTWAAGGALAGGTAGAVAGATGGTFVVPGVGTLVGGGGGAVAGGLAGFVAGGLAGAVKDLINAGQALLNTRAGDLPAKGPPNSSAAKDDGKGNGQIRDYGNDGRAKTDYDFGHDHGAGDPHAHDWDWTKKPPRQPGRPIRPGETPPQ